MYFEEETKKNTLIDLVMDKIDEKFSKEAAEPCKVFAEKLLSNIAYDDIAEREPEDWYGMVLTFWEFTRSVDKKENKISIYNPDFERHAWQSTHTIIQIVHEDMPFLVDSIRMALDRLGFTIHLTIQMGGIKITRDAQDKIITLEKKSRLREATDEVIAPIFFEIDRTTDEQSIQAMIVQLEQVLEDVRHAVKDWHAMRETLNATIKTLSEQAPIHDEAQLAESIAFLEWIKDDHFTFIGARSYAMRKVKADAVMYVVPGSGLGVLHQSKEARVSHYFEALSKQARKRLIENTDIVVISKSNQRSSVHRPVYMDYIVIKQFDDNGMIIGEQRIMGTFTSAAYNLNPKQIPIIRHKVDRVCERSGLSEQSHAGKILLNILQTLPRDDLFQANENELLHLCMSIYHMQERRKIKLFTRDDVYGRFISALVYVPRERYNTELRIQIQEALAQFFDAEEVGFTTSFSDSVLARIHFDIRLKPQTESRYALKTIEQKIIEIARGWEDIFHEQLLESFGEEVGSQYSHLFHNAFPASYREYFSPRTAVHDVKHIVALETTDNLELNFYRPLDDAKGVLRFKLYRYDKTIPLSDVIPILENMGLRILSERPYQLKLVNGGNVWINDFGMMLNQRELTNIDSLRDKFQKAFGKVWFGHVENDPFNQLVLLGEMTWREVSLVRAYAKYFKQMGFTFSQEAIESTLVTHFEIARDLVALFVCRFSPTENPNREQEAESLEENITQAMDEVANLNEDRVLRQYLSTIKATLRTNYFQTDGQGEIKDYIAFKLDPEAIPDMPLPKPLYEIFVYSPRFEGVHLRSGKVARGGLRWSDRGEDFRTEILGLMKAQKVKNAVIVPNGAKGGFYPKQLPENGDRDAIMAEGIACYKAFISGLLDITDNYSNNSTVKPANVVCYDDDDPYLVVAADKGTATFSDIANGIAKSRHFWLGDAFASGGSAGYDHKKMGITARGAWESVKRHFRELGIDCQTEPFTVVGIGDMAGDVFGNGMLLSEKIKLVGAFNHMHIFIDPNPDTDTSFQERERLFSLARSGWDDYNSELISKGGGVFLRSAKSIKLTPEIKTLFDLKQDYIIPNELIKVMLSAHVDLLWNGGIGTFVKSSSESDVDVGDRTNDSIRINAEQLHARVVGEGGNLGLTQLARTDYATLGGRVNSDFIDNSAGVDCSDHEVNIKILLDQVVTRGDLTEKQRNELLESMTDEVSNLVLENNYQQTQAICVIESLATKHIQLHRRYLKHLEENNLIDRELEFLPDDKALKERKLLGKGMVAPGIAVLLAYTKFILKEAILASDIDKDVFLSKLLYTAFPHQLLTHYKVDIDKHRLRREIIATQISNKMINEVGFTFIYRLQDETGANMPHIVQAYTAARELFNMPSLWRNIQALDNKLPASVQNRAITELSRLMRRCSRWFLRYRRQQLNVQKTIEYYGDSIKELKSSLTEVLSEQALKDYNAKVKILTAKGMPTLLASELASINYLFAALDLVDIARSQSTSVITVAKVYYSLGERLDIDWLRNNAIKHPVDSHWEALFREAIRDELDTQQRQLTMNVLGHPTTAKQVDKQITLWSKNYKPMIQRWERVLRDLQAGASITYTMLFVASRELLDLTESSLPTEHGEQL